MKMKPSNLIRSGAIALSAALLLAGCDALATAPDQNAPSRVLLSSSTLAPSFSDALLSQGGANGKGKGNGPIDLATINKIEVQITSIRVSVSAETEGAGSWVDLSLAYDPTTTWFDLKNLGSIQLATVPVELAGPIAAIRLAFGDARVVFDDEHTEELRIPSGKVTIPASGVTVNEGTDVVIAFDPEASVKKIIRTGNGLLMPPVFNVGNRSGGDDAGSASEGRGRGGTDDDDADSDDDDDGSDDGDDDGTNTGDDDGGTGDGDGTNTGSSS